MRAAAGFWRKLQLTLEMIKFEHSVFALPFALTGAVLAIREDGFQTPGLGRKLLLIVLPWWPHVRPQWASIALSMPISMPAMLEPACVIFPRACSQRHLPGPLSVSP